MSEFRKPMLKMLALLPTLDPNPCWPMPKIIPSPRRDGPANINSTRFLYAFFVGELTPSVSLERRSGCHPDCQNPFHRTLGKRGLTGTGNLKGARTKHRFAAALLAEAKDLANNIRELIEDAPEMTRADMFNWFSTQDPNFIGLTLEEFDQTIASNPDLTRALP